MTSLLSTLNAFLDAAADRVARAIAQMHGEAARERKLREAQFAAQMATIAALEQRLADRLATLRDGVDGKSVSIEDMTPALVAAAERAAATTAREELASWDRPKDGTSVTVAEVLPMIESAVSACIATLPKPKDGKDGSDGASVTIDDVLPAIRTLIAEAVAAIPAPRDGKDGKDGRDGLDGKDGEAGRLPIVKPWSDAVHYAGDVVSHSGGCFQALVDTAKEPPHADWICIAAGGRDGADGRSFRHLGTFSEQAEYRALDVVAVNGASFCAKRDNPGPCPGEGWQLIAAQGKQGKPGPRGASMPGQPGPAVAGLAIDDDGVLTLTNADGSVVACDLYPLLSRLG